NCAAGVLIDFYGRSQQQMLKQRIGSERFGFALPQGGTLASPDPIGLFRGAPHKEVANLFIYFVCSEEGQKLMDFKVGSPGGPVRYNVSRAAINKKIYQDAYKPFRSDPD